MPNCDPEQVYPSRVPPLPVVPQCPLGEIGCEDVAVPGALALLPEAEVVVLQVTLAGAGVEANDPEPRVKVDGIDKPIANDVLYEVVL